MGKESFISWFPPAASICVRDKGSKIEGDGIYEERSKTLPLTLSFLLWHLKM